MFHAFYLKSVDLWFAGFHRHWAGAFCPRSRPLYSKHRSLLEKLSLFDMVVTPDISSTSTLFIWLHGGPVCEMRHSAIYAVSASGLLCCRIISDVPSVRTVTCLTLGWGGRTERLEWQIVRLWGQMLFQALHMFMPKYIKKCHFSTWVMTNTPCGTALHQSFQMHRLGLPI